MSKLAYLISTYIAATGNSSLLEDDVQKAMKSTYNHFKDICKDCSSGEVDMESLKDILEKKEEFLELYKIVMTNYPDNYEKMLNLLPRRQLELNAFTDEYAINNNLVKVCRQLKSGMPRLF